MRFVAHFKIIAFKSPTERSAPYAVAGQAGRGMARRCFTAFANVINKFRTLRKPLDIYFERFAS